MNRESQSRFDETVMRDPYLARALELARHVRRYGVIYLFTLLAVLGLILLPTVAGGVGKVSAGSTGGSPYASSGSAAGTAPTSVAASGSQSASGSASRSASGAQTAAAVSGGGPATGAAPAGGSVAAPAGASGAPKGDQVGTGVTVGGVPCQPGVRQLPSSQYADPCVSKFSGANGGSTWNGVTGNTVTVAIRHTSDANGANSVAVEAEVEAAGGVSYATEEQYTQQLVAYFNKMFELYGRQVKLVDFSGQGNYSNEELGQDEAGACADADALASSTHAFGVLDWEGNFETQPFAQCAARYRLYVPEGAAYFPESFYQSTNPYVWAVTMNGTLISDLYAEFAGTQLFPYPSKWAANDGVQSLNGQPRKIATYIPNNAEYQDNAARQKQDLEDQYHVPANRMDQYNYALDISTFPQDAQRAIVQFAADNDTSIELACDPISPIFLTQDAVQQNYYPEWVLNGVALTDTDSFAQLWDQKAIAGHLFGMSQAGDTATLLSPDGEAGKALTAAGVPINPSSVVDYFELLPMFNQLQAAGPNLTPANIGAGTAALPAGGSDTSAEGPWHYGSTHTLILGSRQVYWSSTGTSKGDGKPGTYVPIYADRFFQLGQFPSGEPPYYP